MLRLETQILLDTTEKEVKAIERIKYYQNIKEGQKTILAFSGARIAL